MSTPRGDGTVAVALDDVTPVSSRPRVVDVFRDGRELSGLPPQTKQEGFRNIGEGLRWRSFLQPDAVCYTWVESEKKSVAVTCRDFFSRAFDIAASLTLQYDLQHGEPVVLCFEPGLEFVFAFWGVVLAGGVSVPVYPPHPSRLATGLEGLSHIISKVRSGYHSTFPGVDPQRDTIILTSTNVNRLRQWTTLKSLGKSKWPQHAKWIVSGKMKAFSKAHSSVRIPDVVRGDVCFLQFTSGSTSDPKGVIVTHGSLLEHGISLDERLLDYRPVESVGSVCGVSFLPQYHDMGLISFIIEIGLMHSGHAVVMSPITFIQKPYLWLQMMSDYSNEFVCTGAPNFAFELCLRKVSDEQVKSLDLSGVRFCLNGAEPIRPETIRAFNARFGVCGFCPDVWACSYGLAENTLFTSGAVTMPTTLTVDANLLEKERKIRVIDGSEEDDSSEGIRKVVSCGTPARQCSIAIVDGDTRQSLCDGRVGEIWVHSPYMGGGYWGSPELTAETFGCQLAAESDDYHHYIHWWGQYDGNRCVRECEECPAPCGGGRFLRTGDLGFWYGDYLYVTGRVKDMIIVRGRNIYPHDIERSAEQSCEFLRPGCSAAFSTGFDKTIVYIAEVRDEVSGSDVHEMLKAIQCAVLDGVGIQLDDVVLIPARSIPKTTSGKIKRYKCRELYEARKLKVFGELGLRTANSREKPSGGADVHVLVPIEFVRKELETHIAKLCSVRDVAEIGTVDDGVYESALHILRQLLLRLEGGTIENVDTVVGSTPMHELGLDSMRATTMIQEFSDLLQVPSIPVSTVFQSETVSDLVQRIVQWVQVSGYTPDRVLSLVEGGDVESARKMLALLLHHELAVLGVRADGELCSSEKNISPQHGSLSELIEDAGESTSADSVLERLNVLFGDDVVPSHTEERRSLLLSLTVPELVESMISSTVRVVESDPGLAVTKKDTDPSKFLNRPVRHRSYLSIIVQILYLIYMPFVILVCGYPSYRLLASVDSFFDGFYAIGFFPVTFSAATPGADDRVWDIILYVPLGYILFGLTLTIVLIMHKWVIIGRYRAGTYKLFGTMYLRWWMVTTLFYFVDYIVFQFLRETVLVNLVYKALGARVSLSSRISASISPCFDLVRIGAHARVSGSIHCHHVTQGTLILGPVNIGEDVDLRKGSLTSWGCRVGDGSRIEEMCVLLPETRVQPYQVWSGNPGIVKCSTGSEPMRTSMSWRLLDEFVKMIGMVLIAYTFVGSGIPAYLAISSIFTSVASSFRYIRLVLSLFGYGIHMMTFSIWIIAMKWVVLGRVHEGKSFEASALRKWRMWFVKKNFLFCYVFWINNFGKSLIPVAMMKALGSKMSWTSMVNEASLTTDWDMLTADRGVFLSTAVVDATDPETGAACRVHFHENSWLGIRSVIRGRLEVETGAGVGPHTYCGPSMTVTKGTVSMGNPPSSILTTDIPLSDEAHQRLLKLRIVQTVLLPVILYTYALVSFIPGIEYASEILSSITRDGTGDDFLVMLALSPAYLIVFAMMTACYVLHERVLFCRVLFCPKFPQGRCEWTTFTVSRWAVAYFGMDTFYQRYFSPPVVCGSVVGFIVLRLRGSHISSTAYIESPGYAMDPPMLSFGDGSCVNYGVLLNGHSANSYNVLFGRTHIGRNATLWAHSSCMAPVTVGESANVLFSSKPVDGMVLSAGESWGGVPCRHLAMSRLSRKFSSQSIMNTL